MFFSVLVQHSINCVGYSTLYYKVGFVYVISQPEGNGSVRSTCTGGEAKLQRSGGKCIKGVFNIMVFPAYGGFIGPGPAVGEEGVHFGLAPGDCDRAGDSAGAQ